MTKIKVTQDYRKLSTFLNGLAKSGVKAAVRRSIKRTLPAVRTFASKEFRSMKLIKMPASELKEKIRQYERTSGTINQMYGKIWEGGKGESLAAFFARKVSAGRSSVVMSQDKYGAWHGARLFGVRVTVLGRTYLVQRGFLWQRPGAAKPIILARDGKARLPVTKQLGPSIAELTEKSGLFPRMAQKARETYRREFQANLKFYAERAIQKAKGK